jgi:hypothetical protein
MISIVHLLEMKGLDTSKRIKLVRHQDKRYDVSLIYSLGQIEIYQSYQGKPIFECDYIVSFVGFGGSWARMTGVYRVGIRQPAENVPLPPDFIYQDNWDTEGGVHYELEEVPGFEDLKDRVVIDWGKGALAWHQWLKHKEVVEILPAGYTKKFTGYLDFVLTYDELVKIIKNPIANKEWHAMLSSVAGVYLILDESTGKQYVGSAYGREGILGRWSNYASSGHGGNIILKDVINNNKYGAKSFRFTILQTLPKTLTKNEVIAQESIYKNKLGSLAFGLNKN